MAKFMLHKWLRPVLIGISVLIIIILAIFQPWSGSPSAEEVLAKVKNPEMEIKSYQMKYFSESVEDSTEPVTNAEATYTLPDTFHLKISMGNWIREYINIGETRYERETGTPVDIRGQVIFFSTYIPHEEATAIILEPLTEVEALPDEETGGVLCYRLRGKYDATTINDMLAEIKDKFSEEEFQQIIKQFDKDKETTSIEFLIGKDDYIIRKVKYLTSNQDGEVISTEIIDFSSFNQPVNIEPPLDEDGQLLPESHITGHVTKNNNTLFASTADGISNNPIFKR